MPAPSSAPSRSLSLSFHAETTPSVVAALGVDTASGLATSEAASQLLSHGSNQLAGKPPRPVWRKFLDQFRNFLVIVLLGAAVLAGAIGDIKDALVIATVVLLNGFVPIVLAFIAFFCVLDFHNRTFGASKRLDELAAREG